jgi:multidrug efflux pump subunit AcrA (membrane-fusion protein)
MRVLVIKSLVLHAAAILFALAAATSLPAQNANPAAVPVVLAEARLDPVTEELPLTGTVTARQQAALSPRAAGLVATVHVATGTPVLRLVTIDHARVDVQIPQERFAESA